MRVDKNGNEIFEGDRVETLIDVDGLPAGATGRVAIHNQITGNTISRGFQAILLHLDNPWGERYGYRSDRYERAAELPEPDRNNHWFVSPDRLKIISPLSNEQYTPEDEELFE